MAAVLDSSGIQPDRKVQFLEVSVFLFLVVPSLIVSFFVMKQINLGFVFVALTTILRDLSLVCLILFFVWRNREPIHWIGLTFKNGWNDIALGLLLFVPFTSGIGFIETLLRGIGLSGPSKPLPSFLTPQGIIESLMAFVLVVTVALAEEMIFRGYLIARFRAITFSPIAAVLLSAAIFSLGHGYEGSAGMVTVGVMGAVFSLIYIWRQSLVAPVVMHFLQDFIGIILLPRLGMK